MSRTYPDIASLPMYNWPELRPQTEQWWQALATGFVQEGMTHVPMVFNGHEDPHDDWNDPHLFLSQTCGYPLRHQFQDILEVVAVPCYKSEGCKGAYYSSMVVVRKEDRHLSLGDFGGRRAAFNAQNSQSGYSSLRAVIAPLAQEGRFFATTLKTGAHLNSMAAVADKKADICAIDCVCWSLATRIFPELVAALGVIAQTPMAPALPYVTSKTRSPDEVQSLRRGLLKSVGGNENKNLRTPLLLDGFEILPPAAYARIDEIENTAIAAGYPQLN